MLETEKQDLMQHFAQAVETAQQIEVRKMIPDKTIRTE